MAITRRLIVAACTAAVLLTLTALGAAPARAETAAELQKQLHDARAKIAAAREKKKTLSDQIAGLDSKLTTIEDTLAALGDRIASVEERLSVTREKLEVLREELRLKRAELQKAQKKLDREEALFEERVVLSYKSDDLDYLDVVLSSSSYEDFVTGITVVHDLIAGNDDLVGDFISLRDEVRTEKEAIADREGKVASAVAELQEKSDELAALQAQQAASQAQALAMRKEKAGALSSVKGNLALLEKQEDQILAESAALTGVINGSSGSGHGTGQLMWPVSGTVVSEYGYRVHPISGEWKLHTGMDIAVGYGTPIKAADGGTVIVASWYGGYGNTIVIDHGKGISTLYAHQSSLAVGNGARVSKGQTIGYVGSTGYSTGPHLHFEVRVNGNPVNPRSYL